MKETKTIKIKNWSDIPKNFTGVAEYENGSKSWYKDGKRHRRNGPAVECFDGTKYWYKEGDPHREDGPAVEYSDGVKNWYLEGKFYGRLSLSNYVVLDSYKGEYGIMWHKLLGKDKVVEYPDIPGLIEK
jgi:hypothetical protein